MKKDRFTIPNATTSFEIHEFCCVVKLLIFPFSLMLKVMYEDLDFSQKKKLKKTFRTHRPEKKIGNYWENPVVKNIFEDIESNICI